MWKKNTIQRIVKHKAHKNGIRVSHICAWNTSKLAYDGSGEVLRGKDAYLDTYELCKFSNGKSITAIYLHHIISVQDILSERYKKSCLRRYGLILWRKFQSVRKEHNVLIILF